MKFSGIADKIAICDFRIKKSKIGNSEKDPQTFRPSDLQTFRPSDLQTFRPSDLQTFRPSDLIRDQVCQQTYGQGHYPLSAAGETHLLCGGGLDRDSIG